MSIIKNFIHRKKEDGLTDIRYHPQTNKNQVIGLLDSEGYLDPSLNPQNKAVKEQFNPELSSHYKEFTFESGLVKTVNIYEDATKTNHLFTKSISYSGTQVDTITTTDHTTGKVLTKTFAYSNNQITSITEVIT